MKKALLIIIIAAFVVAFGVVWKLGNNEPDAGSPTACTEEAKLCPDGSSVARTGPNCEFAPCPSQENIGRQCEGLGDASCPVDFECVQGCGPPVVRYPDDTPPSYFCQRTGYERPCPICLAKNTLIDTPLGEIAVQNMQKGAPVWTTTISGERVTGIVLLTSKTAVPSDHTVVRLILADGRELLVSPGHPTIDGRTIGALTAGDVYDGARVVSADRVQYSDGYTYDILSSGETGFYFANGILLDSSL